MDSISLLYHTRQYVESCHLEDGGYFFAKMPPSSAMDTYYAIKILHGLGSKPAYPEKIRTFFSRALKKNSFLGINSLFSAVEVAHALGYAMQLQQKYITRLNSLRNRLGGFGAIENIDIEVVSELETTYRVLMILSRLGMDFNREHTVNFVLRFNNADGGYGKQHVSTLASTFYATEIFKICGFNGIELDKTRRYLKNKGHISQLNYIEDMYWLISGLKNLGMDTPLESPVINFVKGCQRINGGFARKDVMGIPTLEDTYYAVTIFKMLEYFEHGLRI